MRTFKLDVINVDEYILIIMKRKGGIERASVLEPIRDQVFAEKDLTVAKQIIFDALDAHPIQDEGIKLMRVRLTWQIQSKQALDFWLQSHLFAFQGQNVLE